MQNLISRFKEGLYLHTEFVTVEGLPFSFAHISDLHFDNTGKFPAWLRDSVYSYFDHLNHPTQLLCVTGDLVDNSSCNVKEALDFLNSLPINYIVISLGNHDLSSMDSFISLASQYPKIKLFVNNSFQYNNINFICMADIHCKYYCQGISNLHKLYDPSMFNVILSHNPNSFWDIISSVNPSLIISGHTHGGQIAFPHTLRKLFKLFISNETILNSLNINHKDDCFLLNGSFYYNDYHLHVNSGLGFHPPGRIFCPPTITIYQPQ